VTEPMGGRVTGRGGVGGVITGCGRGRGPYIIASADGITIVYSVAVSFS